MRTRNLFSAALTVIFLAVFFADSYSQASFSGKTDFTTGSAPESVASADFNGDGLTDLVVLSSAGNFASVLLNLTSPGASVPSYSPKTDFTTATEPRSVSVDDVNGDGKPDLLIACFSSSSISVLLNTTTPGASTPTFTAKTDFPAVNGPLCITTGDLNCDGRPDMACTNHNAGNISVYINTTSPGAVIPSFTSKVDFSAGANPFSITTADFNGDGLTDIAAANFTSQSISVYLNSTTPGSSIASFPSQQSFSVGNGGITSVTAADFNGDGKPDLAALSYFSNFVSIFLNTAVTGAGTSSFTLPTHFASSTFSFNIKSGDLNKDGRPDIVCTSTGTSIVSIFLNITSPGAVTPAFYNREDFTSGATPESIAIADMNGDGKNDLAVANTSSASVSVFINTMGLGNEPAAFASKVDFSSLLFSRSSSLGDINGDGKPDMIVAAQNSNSVSVFLNTTSPGAATPTFSAKTDLTTGSNPVYVVSGDINGDGKTDLIVTNFNDATVSVLINTTAPGASTPSFSAKTDFTTGSGPIGVILKDINGDGKTDLSVANYLGASVSVLLNTTTIGAATPTFAAKTDFISSAGPVSIQAADLNGDGMPDLVSSNYDNNSISVFFNQTTIGSSTPLFSPKTDFATGLEPHSAALTDLNGDGKPDIITANNAGNSISVFFNTTVTGASSPTLSARTDLTTGNGPHGVSAADLNGDGKTDLISANKFANSISVFLNSVIPGSLTASFNPRQDFSTGQEPYFASIGDLNGDGKTDLVIPNSGSNSVSVLLNDIQLPLPIELESFTSGVDHQNVILNWTTSQEQNNSGFEAERNSFGTGWMKIGFVGGAGTTNQIKNYSFRDLNLSSGHYSYRLKQIDFNGNFKYYELSNEVVVGIPAKFSLSQNYPNPFNPVTKINYSLPASGMVTLKIYDISGREIAQLVNELQQAGYYSLSFNASSISSGTYFYQITAGGFVATKKMMIVK